MIVITLEQTLNLLLGDRRPYERTGIQPAKMTALERTTYYNVKKSGSASPEIAMRLLAKLRETHPHITHIACGKFVVGDPAEIQALGNSNHLITALGGQYL